MSSNAEPQAVSDAPEGRALRAAAQALGLPLSDAQCSALQNYLALLKRWNATYNLTAVRDPAAMLTQHLADCLAVIPPMQAWLAQFDLMGGVSGCRVLDVGSGGGLPGSVIAIMLPALDVSCVDTVGKKAAFVQQVAGQLRLPNLRALHSRVESLRTAPHGIITSRAFGSLADTVRLTAGQLAPGGVWMAMKGRVPDEEIAALPSAIDVFHVEHLHVPGLDAQRCIVWMRQRTAG